MKYSRLVRSATSDILGVQPDHYISHTTESVDFDRIAKEDYLVDRIHDKELAADQIDTITLNSVIQEVFFDLYGTNIPKNHLDEIVNELPDVIPNSVEEVKNEIIPILIQLQAYKWVVDLDNVDDDHSPDSLVDDIEEEVESGSLVYDESDDESDDELNNEVTHQPTKMTSSKRVQATSKKDLIPDAWDVDRYPKNDLGMPIINCDRL